MKKQTLRLVMLVSSLLVMAFAMVSTSSAQTTFGGMSCVINEVGDSFVEVYCLAGGSGIVAAGTADYTSVEVRAGGAVVPVAADVAAGGYGVYAFTSLFSTPGGLTVELVADDGTRADVVVDAVVFGQAEYAALAAPCPTIGRIANGVGPFVANNETPGATNANAGCDTEQLSVALSGVDAAATTPLALVAILFAAMALVTVRVSRRDA